MYDAVQVSPSLVFEDDVNGHEDRVDGCGKEEKECCDGFELHVVADDGNDE